MAANEPAREAQARAVDRARKSKAVNQARKQARVCVQVEVGDLCRLLDLAGKLNPTTDLEPGDIDLILEYQRKAGLYQRLSDGT